MKKKFYFHTNNVKIEDLISDEKIILSTNSFDTEILLSFEDHGIRLLPNNNSTYITVLEKICMFELIDETKVGVLKYLFDRYGLVFYDDEFVSVVSFLNPYKDKRFYDALLKEYIVNCLLHYGIIEDDKIMGNFYNKKDVEEAHKKQHLRMFVKLQILKIEHFFLNLFYSIKKIIFQK